MYKSISLLFEVVYLTRAYYKICTYTGGEVALIKEVLLFHLWSN